MQSQYYYLANLNRTHINFSKILSPVLTLCEWLFSRGSKSMKHPLTKESDIIIITRFFG